MLVVNLNKNQYKLALDISTRAKKCCSIFVYIALLLLIFLE